MTKLRTTLLTLGAFATSSIAFGGELFTDMDFKAAQEKAESSGKMLMVDFKAEWCGPCKVLDRTTWKDEKVVAALDDRAIAVKVDVDEHGDVAAKYGIRAIPTIIFFSPDGKEIKRLTGYRDPQQFLKDLESIASAS